MPYSSNGDVTVSGPVSYSPRMPVASPSLTRRSYSSSYTSYTGSSSGSRIGSTYRTSSVERSYSGSYTRERDRTSTGSGISSTNESSSYLSSRPPRAPSRFALSTSSATSRTSPSRSYSRQNSADVSENSSSGVNTQDSGSTSTSRYSRDRSETRDNLPRSSTRESSRSSGYSSGSSLYSRDRSASREYTRFDYSKYLIPEPTPEKTTSSDSAISTGSRVRSYLSDFNGTDTLRSRYNRLSTSDSPVSSSGTLGRSSRLSAIGGSGGTSLYSSRKAIGSSEVTTPTTVMNGECTELRTRRVKDKDDNQKNTDSDDDVEDDNGNVAQTSVTDLRRRFDSNHNATPKETTVNGKKMSDSDSEEESSCSSSNGSSSSDTGVATTKKDNNVEVSQVVSNDPLSTSSRRFRFRPHSPTKDEKSKSTPSTSQGVTRPNRQLGLSHGGAVQINGTSIVEDNEEEENSLLPSRGSRGTERGGLVGLRNIGNTCFMNSVLQCLSNTRPLLEYILKEQHLSEINTTISGMKGALIKAFATVISELWKPDSEERTVNTTSFKSQIQRFAPRFIGYSQQDAQEFLRYLLEGLHEDVNRVTSKPRPITTDIDESLSDVHKAMEAWKRYLRFDDSKIVDLFVGQLKSTLKCTVCGHCSVTFDPFWDLSLPIPSRTGQVRLQQCFDLFTREEVLDGDEKPTCSRCQTRRKCTKSLSIQKFPKILVLHLKRFSPMERFRGKLNCTVDFPLTSLDLNLYAANKGQGCIYNLYGVANHSGTTYSGHYTAYCKHPYTESWHEYNDSRVSPISSRSVVSSEAYVLFYEMAGQSSHL